MDGHRLLQPRISMPRIQVPPVMRSVPMLATVKSLPVFPTGQANNFPLRTFHDMGWGRRSRASEIGHGIGKSALILRRSSGVALVKDNKNRKRSSSLPNIASVNSVCSRTQQQRRTIEKQPVQTKPLFTNFLRSKKGTSHSPVKKKIHVSTACNLKETTETLARSVIGQPKVMFAKDKGASDSAYNQWKKNKEASNELRGTESTVSQEIPSMKEQRRVCTPCSDASKRSRTVTMIGTDYITSDAAVGLVRSFIARDMLAIQAVIQDIKILPTSKLKKEFANDVLTLKQQFDRNIMKIKSQVMAENFKQSGSCSKQTIVDMYSDAKLTVSSIEEMGQEVKASIQEKQTSRKRPQDNVVTASTEYKNNNNETKVVSKVETMKPVKVSLVLDEQQRDVKLISKGGAKRDQGNAVDENSNTSKVVDSSSSFNVGLIFNNMYQ